MKNKYSFLMLALVAITLFSSCNCGKGCKPQPPSTATGSAIQDSLLDQRLFRLVHNSSTGSNYFAYYYTNTLIVDTTQSPPKLTLTGQAAKYDSTNQSWVLHNGATTSQVSSAVSVNTDIALAKYLGPFDPILGQFYTSKGYLHYFNSSTFGDSTLCPVSRIVYWNQNGKGQPISVGYVQQNDLH